jgi:hypothetical protein
VAVVAPPAGDAASRDEQRNADLAAVAGALDQYAGQFLTFPSTNGEVRPLCAVPSDAGCGLSPYLNPIPADPLGEPTTNGYFYASDGLSYSVFALLEDDASQRTIDCPFYDTGALPDEIGLCVTGRWR